MSREFTHWNHVRGFLEFESLLIDESTFLVDNDVRVHGTRVAVFSGKFGAIAGTRESNAG
jgi:hypothetical protein